MGGRITNHSRRNVWIFGDDKTLVLPSGKSSQDIGVRDADGLLLDGLRVFFKSRCRDLGGGRVFREGAFKVCNLGVMTIIDGDTTACDLVVSISWLGFLCPLSQARYKTPEWCRRHDGWVISGK